tara:strand:+ start:186 stop:1130 length:945 start_codon:yes stop_codon:yes gene_type:complete
VISTNNFYIYRHIRLDDLSPFYIGLGSKPKVYNTFKQEYRRAFAKSGRNKHWKNIVNKVDYRIEILFEANDYNVIQEKEKEFIKLYGRLDNGTGILVNYTDGGIGSFNLIPETKKKITEGSYRKIYQYSKDGIYLKEWKSITTASSELNLVASNITSSAKGVVPHCGGYQWSYSIKELQSVEIQKNTNMPVYQYNLSGDLLKIWDRAKDITDGLEIKSSCISACTSGKQKSAGGYIWTYSIMSADIIKSVYTPSSKRQPVLATNIKTGEEIMFVSQTEAAISLNIKQNCISRVVLGIRNQTGGYKFVLNNNNNE